MKTVIRTSLLWFSLASAGLSAGDPETWIPARWDGGPLEVAHRAKDKTLANPNVRDAISQWYEPATLALLDGMPVNCLLLTFSGGDDADLVQRQQRLVKEYAGKARERGLAVLGLVYPGSSGPSAIAKAAAEANLDGVVLEGEFPGGAGFAEQALRHEYQHGQDDDHDGKDRQHMPVGEPKPVRRIFGTTPGCSSCQCDSRRPRGQ